MAGPPGFSAGTLGLLLDGGGFKPKRRIRRSVPLAGFDEPDLVLHSVYSPAFNSGPYSPGGGGRKHSLLRHRAFEPLHSPVPGPNPVPGGHPRLAYCRQRSRGLRFLVRRLHPPGLDPAGLLPVSGMDVPRPAPAGQVQAHCGTALPAVLLFLLLCVFRHRYASGPGDIHPAVGHSGQRFSAQLHRRPAVQPGGQARRLQPRPGPGADGAVPRQAGRRGRGGHPGHPHRHQGFRL